VAMLDIRKIIECADLVQRSIQARGVKVNVDELLHLNEQRKSHRVTLDNKRSEANVIAKKIPAVKDAQKQELVAIGRALNQEITVLEEALREIEQRYHEAMLSVPNFLAEDTPPGESDADNIVVKSHLVPRTFTFVPNDHVEIGKALDLLDFEAGAKVTGAKFYFLKNEAVLLELALKLFAIKIAAEHGYVSLITPDLAKRSILEGTGFSPRGEESNIYNLADLDLSLIATAEITVGGLHADEILAEDQLPLKYVAESHCFRREAGAAGKESKGLYRVHQFSKIELFCITKPEESEAALQEILTVEEKIYQQLELPYRVVRICAGDLGAPAYKKYDIEVWMPGRSSDEKYGEVTSASNCTDFQARRLNIKYRDKENRKFYPYTLNGTAVALSRTMLAILENYQQEDGSVVVPKVLRPYVGKEVISRR